ncbi:DNA polymerase III subunit delta' [Rhabdaerophilum sp. SD176]|uniref:DNA polymerase III subunit delta' n=1 Tax=Rhabdaerophilum sp. SD176 TaxID=2983548 RepID=UPI0024E01087|nr:DNA polymerase III subunit delta' [Rhabdaerophilum sp. SD176]
MVRLPRLALPPPEYPEIDRSVELPHPRAMLGLVGHNAAEAEFLSLYRAGTLHHAFLLTGPQGIGKATFAYRAARFLLAEGERASGLFGEPRDLAVEETSRTAQLIANEAHPDLVVLKRRYKIKEKKIPAEIGVEDTRAALGLFSKTAAFGGWRIIIIDSVDDLNSASANAILKTLEEPPARAMFLMVSHQPERLLPTIRSRCRVLPFQPLPAADLAVMLPELLPGASLDPAMADWAEGSVRRALRLADPKLRSFLVLVDGILQALPKRLHREIDQLAEAVRGAEQALPDMLERIEWWLHGRIRSAIAAGDLARAQDLAEFWSRMQEGAGQMEAFNLDRRAYVITLVDELSTLVSGRGR